MRKQLIAIAIATLFVLPSFALAERAVHVYSSEAGVAELVDVEPLVPGKEAKGFICMAWTEELPWPWWATSYFTAGETFYFNHTLYIKKAGKIKKCVILVKGPGDFKDKIVYEGPWFLEEGAWYWFDYLNLEKAGIYTLTYKIVMGDKVRRHKVKVVVFPGMPELIE